MPNRTEEMEHISQSGKQKIAHASKFILAVHWGKQVCTRKRDNDINQIHPVTFFFLFISNALQ